MSCAVSRGLVGMETLLPVGDVELCVDTVGSPTDTALLLIGTTIAAWDHELVERLTGRFVIRYDLRDAGRSTTVDPDSPGYTLRDLVTDAVGVLDGLGIARPHVDPGRRGGHGPGVLRLATVRRRRGPRPRGRRPRPLRSAPGVGTQRSDEHDVLKAGLHATLARTAHGDHRTDTGGARRSRPVLPGG